MASIFVFSILFISRTNFANAFFWTPELDDLVYGRNETEGTELRSLLFSDTNETSRVQPHFLIVNGQQSSYVGFFVRVYALPPEKSSKVLRCGGSLIRTRWVVTAAECVYKIKPRKMIVDVGRHDLWNGEREERAVIKVIWHEEYNPFRSDNLNNIALLKLSQPQPVYKTIPICTDTDLSCSPLVACGMGTTLPKRYREPSSLRETTFVQTSRRGFFSRCPEQLICTYKTRGDLGNICAGDIGGPLYLYEQRTRVPKCLYGVASHVKEHFFTNEKCAGPSFFANLRYFENWIFQTIVHN